MLGVDAVVGQKPILTDKEEVKLEDYLLKCCEMGVGKTKQQVKETAYEIVKRAPQGRNPSIIQKWLDHEKAGDDWYYRFMSRHPNLSLRKPEKLAHSRAVMANKTVADHYYTKLEGVFNRTTCPAALN